MTTDDESPWTAKANAAKWTEQTCAACGGAGHMPKGGVESVSGGEAQFPCWLCKGRGVVRVVGTGGAALTEERVTEIAATIARKLWQHEIDAHHERIGKVTEGSAQMFKEHERRIKDTDAALDKTHARLAHLADWKREAEDRLSALERASAAPQGSHYYTSNSQPGTVSVYQHGSREPVATFPLADAEKATALAHRLNGAKVKDDEAAAPQADVHDPIDAIALCKAYHGSKFLGANADAKAAMAQDMDAALHRLGVVTTTTHPDAMPSSSAAPQEDVAVSAVRGVWRANGRDVYSGACVLENDATGEQVIVPSSIDYLPIAQALNRELITPAAAPQGTPVCEEVCQWCHGANVVWFAPNELWNRVVTDPLVHFLCPSCFAKAASQAGAWDGSWRFVPDNNDAESRGFRSAIEAAARVADTALREAQAILAEEYADDPPGLRRRWKERAAEAESIAARIRSLQEKDKAETGDRESSSGGAGSMDVPLKPSHTTAADAPKAVASSPVSAPPPPPRAEEVCPACGHAVKGHSNFVHIPGKTTSAPFAWTCDVDFQCRCAITKDEITRRLAAARDEPTPPAAQDAAPRVGDVPAWVPSVDELWSAYNAGWKKRHEENRRAGTYECERAGMFELRRLIATRTPRGASVGTTLPVFEVGLPPGHRRCTTPGCGVIDTPGDSHGHDVKKEEDSNAR